MEAAITKPSRGTSEALMHLIPSYLQKPKPCYFPLQGRCGYRLRKALFFQKSFKVSGTNPWLGKPAWFSNLG